MQCFWAVDRVKREHLDMFTVHGGHTHLHGLYWPYSTMRKCLVIRKKEVMDTMALHTNDGLICHKSAFLSGGQKKEDIVTVLGHRVRATWFEASFCFQRPSKQQGIGFNTVVGAAMMANMHLTLKSYSSLVEKNARLVIPFQEILKQRHHSFYIHTITCITHWQPVNSVTLHLMAFISWLYLFSTVQQKKFTASHNLLNTRAKTQVGLW